jgi:hypothetical protein
MIATVTRTAALVRKPNRRPGVIPARPDTTVVQLADYDLRRRADTWAAAYRREQARPRPRPWPARTAT